MEEIGKFRFPIATAIPIPIQIAIPNGFAVHSFAFRLKTRRTGKALHGRTVARPEAVVSWTNEAPLGDSNADGSLFT